MTWIEEASPVWIGRDDDKPVEHYASVDWVWSTIMVERSVDLQQADPGFTLRAAIAEAIDRHPLGERLDLVSFGADVMHHWELPVRASLGASMAVVTADLTEHTHVDLYGSLSCQAQCSDGPEFFVLLCSPHVDVDRRLLYADADLGADYDDAHWPVLPPTDPNLTTPVSEIFDEHGHRFDPSGDVHRPGGRYDACFVIASIGGEPSPELRHLAELSGGIALPVRDSADAEAFATECAARFQSVVAALDARVAEHEAWLAERERGVIRELPGVPDADAPAERASTSALDGPDRVDLGGASERLAEQAATYLAIEEAMRGWEEHEPRADEFIHVDVLVERSVAAAGADPSGAARRAVVDALCVAKVGRSRSLSSYGWGLISTHGLLYVDEFSGPVRQVLRAPNDHTRVDLGRACRQIQRLCGPAILIVLGSSQAETFDVETTGIDYDDGSGVDKATWEPVGDAQRYEKELEGRYPTIVVFGALDGGVRPEVAQWAEATGGFAMPIQEREEISAFARRCADLYAEWVEQIEAECTAGLLELDRFLA